MVAPSGAPAAENPFAASHTPAPLEAPGAARERRFLFPNPLPRPPDDARISPLHPDGGDRRDTQQGSSHGQIDG
jgi:hypothetical protein